ncbi:hypothetical protein DSO57_1023917 [Entomophthora muscae]|uniref:Uncharacterized protein n=1 Tax=Entomophthora muscae TaxID=34485 RepID=A0ACC2U0L7_9FUNG|nr:hypothetical protein DSO57_1023917 [Entomophthora muscae]
MTEKYLALQFNPECCQSVVAAQLRTAWPHNQPDGLPACQPAAGSTPPWQAQLPLPKWETKTDNFPTLNLGGTAAQIGNLPNPDGTYGLSCKQINAVTAETEFGCMKASKNLLCYCQPGIGNNCLQLPSNATPEREFQTAPSVWGSHPILSTIHAVTIHMEAVLQARVDLASNKDPMVRIDIVLWF